MPTCGDESAPSADAKPDFVPRSEALVIKRDDVDARICSLRIEIGTTAKQQIDDRYHNGSFHHTHTRL